MVVRRDRSLTQTDDLGMQAWDLVFIANLVHHFDEKANRDLVRRIALALRPEGILVIQDFIRVQQPGEGGQIGALNELYFALTSQSGTCRWRRSRAGNRRRALCRASLAACSRSLEQRSRQPGKRRKADDAGLMQICRTGTAFETPTFSHG
jgi:SAM-dependent methyltransferase